MRINTRRIGFLQLLGPLFNILVEVDDVMLILLIHQRRGNHKSAVALLLAIGIIVNLGDSKKRLDIRIVRLGGQGIGEEDDKINLSLDDFCTDLLVAAQRTLL